MVLLAGGGFFVLDIYDVNLMHKLPNPIINMHTNLRYRPGQFNKEQWLQAVQRYNQAKLRDNGET